MNFKASDFALLFLLLLIAQSCDSGHPRRNSQLWSVRMTESVMKRCPQSWMVDFREKPKWEYTEGLVMKAVLHVWQKTKEKRYWQYVYAYYDQFVDDEGNIMTYDLNEFNIDRINPGKPLFTLFKETGDEKFKKAIFLLREQMKSHPRMSEGGFWHKKIYPHQMWLDGIYMASPFLAEFAQTFNESQLFDEVANQIIIMERHARDENTGLLYHGWDASRQQRWADPISGRSPNCWGRAMGWYAMALVDVLDFLPIDFPERAKIIAILNRLAETIAKYQDKESGLWYQIVDQAGKEGNYVEASVSTMFVYALIKAVKNHYIVQEYEHVALKGYEGILQHFIKVADDGEVSIIQTCGMAGLGGNPYRDGSFEYYVGEKIRTNDPKAIGPFILASLEIESMNWAK